MADALGVSDQGVNLEGTSTDYLGVKSPTAFRGQPALPSGARPAAGGAAPPTTAAGTAQAGAVRPLESGPSSQTTFLDLSGATGGDTSAEGPQGSPAVGGTGSFPQSFDLASINLGQLGLVAPDNPAAGVGGKIGPTGVASFTSGNKTIDSLIGTAGKIAGIPFSESILGILGTLSGSPVLGALAGVVGVAGLPLAMAQIAHAIASNIDGTIASNINSVLSDPQLTPEMQANFMADIAQGFPMSGGPQAPSGVPGSFQGPSGAAFGTGGSTGPTAPAANLADMSLSPTFAALAEALGFGREDLSPNPPSSADAAAGVGPAGSGSGVPGDVGGVGSGQSGPAGAGVGGPDSSGAGPGAGPGDATGDF